MTQRVEPVYPACAKWCARRTTSARAYHSVCKTRPALRWALPWRVRVTLFAILWVVVVLPGLCLAAWTMCRQIIVSSGPTGEILADSLKLFMSREALTTVTNPILNC